MQSNHKKTAVSIEKTAVNKTNVVDLQPVKGAPIFTVLDFKDAGPYSRLHKASLSCIAWEFLRRNPAYQQSWAEYAARVRKMAAAHPHPDVSAYAELMLSSFVGYEDVDALGDRERINEIEGQLNELGYLCECPDDPQRQAPLNIQYGRPWGLKRIVHPNTTYDNLWVRWLETACAIPYPLSNARKSSEELPGKAFGISDTKWIDLRIDASLPLSVIDAQLKEMVRIMRYKKIQEGAINPISSRDLSQKTYAGYLRILDARAAGLVASEIGRIIEPERINQPESRQRDKRYAAALSEAKRLCDDGYKVLPLLGFHQSHNNADKGTNRDTALMLKAHSLGKLHRPK